MIKSMNIAWWVKRWSELHPYKTAVIFDGFRTSYLELHQKVNQASCWLQSLGIEKGDRVAVMLSNCPEFLELFLACSRTGAIFVPINYRLAEAELGYTLKNARPRLFAFGGEFADTVASLKLGNRCASMLLAEVAESPTAVTDNNQDYKGATMILHRRFDPRQTYRDIHRYHVTKFLGVPTVYKALVKSASKPKSALSSLKVCAIGGEKLTSELMAQFEAAGFSLRQIMGQTETSILLWAHEKDVSRKPGSVGKPVFHAEVRIVDQQGRTCASGEVGEIVVRGSIMMTEYWQDPVKTAETIRGGWLHTGDLARMDEEGCYYLVDRARDMYISGGENVYPAEIERVLRPHPAVEDIAVVGVPDETWGEVGCAFVIAKAGAEIRSQDLINYCEGQLAHYKWPRQVIFADQFPRTALGKVRKTALREQYSG